MAPVQNSADATGTKDSYPIVFQAQQFKDQVDDDTNGDESDCFDEDKIDMGEDNGNAVKDDSDKEWASRLSVFCSLLVAMFRFVCVQFVSHFGISISEAVTHFSTGFGG